MPDIYGFNNSFEFIRSGSTILDCAIGGGFPLGRISNIIAGSGIGKSLLSIEAGANFSRQYPDGEIVYIETESAFDEEYAKNIGLKDTHLRLERDIYTVENLRDLLLEEMEKRDKDTPALYIVDSLDGLSDMKAEENFVSDKGNYGTKSKMLSSFFQFFDNKLAKTKTHMIIVSQIRENLNAGPYGNPYRVAGGKALEFYCSQRIWLYSDEKIEKTFDGEKRIVGNWIRIKVIKNRISAPHRECYVAIIYRFGIDNLLSNLSYLFTEKVINEFEGLTKSTFGDRIWKMEISDDPKKHALLREWDKIASAMVVERWKAVENGLSVKFSKYED